MERLGKMIKFIKQLVCNHDMHRLNNQPLNANGCFKCKCSKCEKVERVYDELNDIYRSM